MKQFLEDVAIIVFIGALMIGLSAYQEVKPEHHNSVWTAQEK